MQIYHVIAIRILINAEFTYKEGKQKDMKMFSNGRYITKGAREQIPLRLQLFMWECIDKLKEQRLELDYLQVFELSRDRLDDIFFQSIEHKQEVPKYSKTHRVFPKEMVNEKVFVVDDGDHSTMMLASEY